MPRKMARGFTFLELLFCMLVLGVLFLGGLYLVYRTVGRSAVLTDGNTEMVESWLGQMQYTRVSSSCQTLGLVVRCTVRTEQLERPLSLDCNSISRQCSLTPTMTEGSL